MTDTIDATVQSAGLAQPYRARRQNWCNQLARHALMQPDATAIRYLGHSISWAELHQRVQALADALSRRGVGFETAFSSSCSIDRNTSNHGLPSMNSGPLRSRSISG